MDLNFFGSTEAEVFLSDARLRRRAFKEYKEMACLCIVRADEVREKWEISIAKCGYALVAELLYSCPRKVSERQLPSCRNGTFEH